MALDLPTTLAKNGQTREATTASEHWDLVYKGWVPSDSDAAKDELSPQQRAAITRRQNAAQADGKPETQKPDEDIRAQAGDANQS